RGRRLDRRAGRRRTGGRARLPARRRPPRHACPLLPEHAAPRPSPRRVGRRAVRRALPPPPVEPRTRRRASGDAGDAGARTVHPPARGGREGPVRADGRPRPPPGPPLRGWARRRAPPARGGDGDDPGAASRAQRPRVARSAGAGRGVDRRGPPGARRPPPPLWPPGPPPTPP